MGLWKGLVDTFGSPVYPLALPARRRTAPEAIPPLSDATANRAPVRPRPDGLAQFPLSPSGRDSLRISLSHRVVCVGTTGSGKTTWARLFLRRVQDLWPHVSIYVLDSKDAGDFEGWPGLVTGDDVPSPLTSPDGGIQVWRPDRCTLPACSEWLERILRTHDRTRPAIVLIDELSSVAPSRERYADGLALILKQGRGKAVSVLSLTQNAVNIPPEVLGQTTYLVRFRLQRMTDARRADDLLWRDGKVREPDEAHGFHVRRLDVPADAPLVYKDARQLFS